MTWQEARKLYPDQFIKFEIVESHIVGDKEIVDEIAIIKPITDGKIAMKEFVSRKEGQFVYSTKNETLIIQLIKHVGIRSVYSSLTKNRMTLVMKLKFPVVI